MSRRTWKDESVAMRVPRTLRAAMEQLAEAESMNLSEWMRQALREQVAIRNGGPFRAGDVPAGRSAF